MGRIARPARSPPGWKEPINRRRKADNPEAANAIGCQRFDKREGQDRSCRAVNVTSYSRFHTP